MIDGWWKIGAVPSPPMRRAAVAAILAIVVLGVLGAEAQQPSSRVPRVGVIGEQSAADPFIAAFQQGLRDLGYVEGRSIVLEYRYAHGMLDRVSRLAAELIRLQVDVLLVGGTVSAQRAKAQTTTVPIVFVLPGDPVGSGLVGSLARPEGNLTGLSSLHPELGGKQIGFLKEVAPQLSRVAVLYNPVNPIAELFLSGVRAAARDLELELLPLQVRRPGGLPGVFSAVTAGRAGALLTLSDPVFGGELAQLSQLAAKHRLPTLYARREFAEAGGLLSYGPSFPENYRRAAFYVDRILKGARPADLPVEQPRKLELVVNLKTAEAFGLTIPPSLLGRADEVIQ